MSNEKNAPKAEKDSLQLSKKTLKSLKLGRSQLDKVRGGLPPEETGTKTSCNGWCTNAGGYCCPR